MRANSSQARTRLISMSMSTSQANGTRRKLGPFHETAKVMNRLFGGIWRIAEFNATNSKLGCEGCHIVTDLFVNRYAFGLRI
jgi:hypothetical protein